MNNILKIVLVVDDFPPIEYTSGGKMVLALCKEFVKRKHKVYVITSVQSKINERKEIVEGIEVHRIFSNYKPKWKNWLGLYNPRVISKFRKIISGINPDIVNFRHIHRHISFFSILVAKKYSGAVFLTANDVLLISSEKILPQNNSCFYKVRTRNELKNAGKGYNPFRNKIIKIFLKKIDEIFVISDALGKLLKLNGIKNKIVKIYNGIDTEEWQENKQQTEIFKKKFNLKNKKIVSFGGRLSPAKGAEAILHAFKIIKQKIPNTVLLVNGSRGWYGEKMQNLINDLGLENNIVFTGFLTGDELKAYYYSATICTLPSLCFEALGMTGLEVMACRKPLIGTCFGGTPELIEEARTGFIVNPFNESLLAERIIYLLQQPQKAEEFGLNGFAKVESEFSLRKQTNKTLEEYLEVLKQKNKF